ncbi:GntR family transcriptional regulator [Actinocorallia sp. A-T 12471]|uniref:GntR family transcriptional regulator n=1 Tax=Actinocorallia sp. A-T 12471 TaxID=3089813 RepID=UPI0029CFB54E|nr:GntR family transcriptional regulator [Actinocorallia sp. A-T 12471]MDX6740039.1 GntR family transcriptional regulator [Actinocorallia sp. A-T 12471]
MTQRQSPVRSVAGRKASAVDLVLHEIRRSILTGALPPGQPFIVQTLTEQLGVSHVPIREALRQLEAQGLITLSPSRSAVVAPLDPDDVRSIFRLRRMVEPELAAKSVADRSEDDITRLEQALAETFRDDIGEDQFDLHREYHRLLISPAASEWDLRLLSPLWDASERFSRLVFDPVDAGRDAMEARHSRHAILLTAARGRAADLMRAELTAHLMANERRILTALEGVADPESPTLNQDTA